MTEPDATTSEGGEFPEASFTRHLFDLAQQVAIALGEVENPITKRRDVHLPAAQFLIDTIAMLEEKTRGNRTSEEDSYVQGVLANLRVAFVSKSSS